MRASELEHFVRETIRAARDLQHAEDSRCELKSEWPPNQKAARQLAGHANAARGERIFWIIGVDERGSITGAPQCELANWPPAVQSCFLDGVAPRLHCDVSVHVDDKTVVGMAFDTTNAPFLIPAPPGSKGPDAEVPWRDGRRTRSARRADLLQILVPAITQPRVDVLDGWLTLTSAPNAVNEDFTIALFLYITPRGRERISFPFHTASAVVDSRFPDKRYDLWDVDVQPRPLRHRGSVTLQSTGSELHVDGPGLATLTAAGRRPTDAFRETYDIDVEWGLRAADDDVIVTGSVALESVRPTDIHGLGGAAGLRYAWRVKDRTSDTRITYP